MDVLIRSPWCKFIAGMCCCLPMTMAFATTYNYPTTPNFTAPFTINDGDTANILSGTFATTNAQNYSLALGINTGTQTVNTAVGATLGYQGTDSVGRSLVSTRSDVNASTEVINNSGSINSGTGLFAIYMTNSNTGALNTVEINSTGTIIGGILLNGAAVMQLNLDSSAAVAPADMVQGGVTMTPKIGTGTSTLNVGKNIAGTIYTTAGTLQGMTLIHVQNDSMMNLQFSASQIKKIQIDAGSTFSVNAILGGQTVDDVIANSGALNISADITKTGAINTLAGGTTYVRENVTLNTTSFDSSAGTYASVFNDVLNNGDMNLPDATTVKFGAFSVLYEGNGYLPGRTYTLVNTGSGINTLPTGYTLPPNTMFLTFNPPFQNGNTIQMVITRTPFQNYAQTAMTQQVGIALEAVGSETNPPQDVVTLLDAVELSNSPTQLESVLRQLAPLISAPLYGVEIQMEMMEQVELRLAELRNRNSYFAGDIAIQNAMWLRPFGDQANQQAVGDSLGYYATTGGLALGLDRYIDSGFLLGVAGSYALSHVIDKINSSSITDVKSYQVMLYGSVDLSETKYANWNLAAAANNYDASRYMNINGLQMVAGSKYSSQIYGVKGILGKYFSAFHFLQVNPEMSGQYTFAKQYEYNENGAPGANLVVNRDNSNVVQLGAGGKLSVPLDWHPGICVPEIHAMAYYNVVNGLQQTTANFLSGGGVIIANMPLPRSWLKIGAAVTFALLDRFQVKLNYDHWIADRFTDNAFYLNLKYSL